MPSHFWKESDLKTRIPHSSYSITQVQNCGLQQQTHSQDTVGECFHRMRTKTKKEEDVKPKISYKTRCTRKERNHNLTTKHRRKMGEKRTNESLGFWEHANKANGLLMYV